MGDYNKLKQKAFQLYVSLRDNNVDEETILYNMMMSFGFSKRVIKEFKEIYDAVNKNVKKKKK